MEIIATKSRPIFFIPLFICVILCVVLVIIVPFLDYSASQSALYYGLSVTIFILFIISVINYLRLPKNLITYDKAAGEIKILKHICRLSDIVTVRYDIYGKGWYRALSKVSGAKLVVVLKDKQIKVNYVREVELVHDRLIQLAMESRSSAKDDGGKTSEEHI